jgi:hypothetical protein
MPFLPHVEEALRKVKASTTDEVVRLNRINSYFPGNGFFQEKAEEMTPEQRKSWLDFLGLGREKLRRIQLED